MSSISANQQSFAEFQEKLLTLLETNNKNTQDFINEMRSENVEPITNYKFENRKDLDDAITLWIDDNKSALSKYGDINTWNVSAIKDMSNLFSGKTKFNSDISNWDVSNVTDMSNMFSGASLFNQDISTKKITEENSATGQPYTAWDVSKVTRMGNMFANAYAFNQNIGSWDVSSVTIMINTFGNATSFNQDISDWNVSNVTDMTGMFDINSNAPSDSTFNQDIRKWDVSSVIISADGANGFNNMFFSTKLMKDNYNAPDTPDATWFTVPPLKKTYRIYYKDTWGDDWSGNAFALFTKTDSTNPIVSVTIEKSPDNNKNWKSSDIELEDGDYTITINKSSFSEECQLFITDDLTSDADTLFVSSSPVFSLSTFKDAEDSYTLTINNATDTDAEPEPEPEPSPEGTTVPLRKIRITSIMNNVSYSFPTPIMQNNHGEHITFGHFDFIDIYGNHINPDDYTDVTFTYNNDNTVIISCEWPNGFKIEYSSFYSNLTQQTNWGCIGNILIKNSTSQLLSTGGSSLNNEYFNSAMGRGSIINITLPENSYIKDIVYKPWTQYNFKERNYNIMIELLFDSSYTSDVSYSLLKGTGNETDTTFEKYFTDYNSVYRCAVISTDISTSNALDSVKYLYKTSTNTQQAIDNVVYFDTSSILSLDPTPQAKSTAKTIRRKRIIIR